MIGNDSIYLFYRKIDLAKRTQEHRITNRESNNWLQHSAADNTPLTLRTAAARSRRHAINEEYARSDLVGNEHPGGKKNYR